MSLEPPKESVIQAACLDLLRLRGLFAWRNNTGAMRWQTSAGKLRLFRFGSVGSGDIFAIHAGIFISIEVKRPGNKPTEAQEAWMAAVRKAGGEAWWVSDVAELSAHLDRLMGA